MTSKKDRAIVVSALKHAAPYIRLFKNKVFVIKAGGEIFADAGQTREFMEQVGILHQVGIRVVLIHGGGPQSTRLAAALGLDTKFIEGRRVTDGASLDVATMVLNGQINTRILATCRDLQVPAVGMSGVDAGLIRAHQRPPVERDGEDTVDYGFVGDIDGVDASVLQKQLDNGLMPVISPLSCDESGTLLNINADTVAAAIAAELDAEKLILATGAAGILEDIEDPGSLISYMDRAALDKLKASGSLADGMLPKAAAIDAALANGVQRVHVISYKLPDSLLLEVFTNEGTGTLVVDDIAALTPAEQGGELVSRLWEKGLPLDERVLRYTAGEDHLLDARLVPYDVRGSIAHAEMLAGNGLISETDCADIREGLLSLQQSFEDGEWHIGLEDEDAHTALETRLTAKIGDAGARLHLGRSRNDQVLTALRLYLRDAALDLATRVDKLKSALGELAERQGEVELPGYTHMQHAMPSSVALWCGGFEEGFSDAIEGLQATNRRINKNPLGSAAGYGTPGLPLDRDMTTAALEFSVTQSPVTSVQLSRGKAESALLFEITLLTQDLGRMASDLLLFYTQEFAYVALAAEVTTGSSIMPQKRNPDVLELLRASSATAHACLDESLMITAKLPSGYQRDLQRLKSPLFRSIDLAIDSVDIMAYLLQGLQFLPENIELDEGIFATAEAYRLVTENGIPFRDAYREVAKRYAK